MMEKLQPMRVGILFAFLTLVFGFGLGGVFGAFEDNIKGHLKAEAQAVFNSQYNGNEEEMKKVLGKSWVYFKRAHLHANGLGTTSLVLIILLSFLPVSTGIKKITALSLGLGSFGYSLFWMFSGLKAPGVGGTHAAKESLKWLAIPSSGLCIIGLVVTVILTTKVLFSKTVVNTPNP